MLFIGTRLTSLYAAVDALELGFTHPQSPKVTEHFESASEHEADWHLEDGDERGDGVNVGALARAWMALTLPSRLPVNKPQTRVQKVSQ